MGDAVDADSRLDARIAPGHRYVDGPRDRQQIPPGRGGAMAGNRAVAAGQHGGSDPRGGSRRREAYEIHASMPSLKPARSDPGVNRRPVETHLSQLRTCHNVVLPRCDLSQTSLNALHNASMAS
jgi:hypothetical protein